MRGLIYKEVSVFYKSVDKKMFVIASGFTLLIFYRAGAYGGMMASVMLAMIIGAQNVMSFISDDKARCKGTRGQCLSAVFLSWRASIFRCCVPWDLALRAVLR